MRVYVKKAAERGLLILSAGSDTVRLLPPLNITDAELSKGVALLISVLDE